MPLNASADFSADEELHSLLPPLDRAPSAAQLPTSTGVGKKSINNPLALLEASDVEASINSQTSHLLASPAFPSQLGDCKFGNVKLLEPWFPRINPDNFPSHWWTRRKVILWTSFTLVFFICVTNLVLAAIAWSGYKITDGAATLYEGDCTVAKRADSGLHVLINVLGTLLLGASNLVLQLIVAPTRQEVDKAHAKGVWLNIGVPSFHNLRHLSKTSLVLWFFLTISSIPIHFLYNSTVFSSLSTNDIAWVIVNDSFLNDTNWDIAEASFDREKFTPEKFTPEKLTAVSTIHNDYYNNSMSYKNHSTSDCLNAYHSPFRWRPSKLIMVTSTLGANPSASSSSINSSVILDWNIHDQLATQTPNFLCHSCNSSIPKNTLSRRTLSFGDRKIEYCLYKAIDIGQSTVNSCQLQCSPPILLVVGIFNLIKCLCILWVALFDRGSRLCILGDAIASFLETPDQTTKSLGIVSRKSIKQLGKHWSKVTGSRISWRPIPIQWRYAASTRRWTFTGIAFVVTFATGLGVIIEGVYTEKKYHRSIGLKPLWAMGFGDANPDQIISWKQANEGTLGIFANVLIANTAQVTISFVYVALNALLSCMLVADEWAGFSKDRKTLRVSSPAGMQRSSYVLSVPLRYGLPTMVIFAVLHWLISQSIFIVRVVRVDWEGKVTPAWTTAGYSLIPSYLTATFSLLMMLCLVLLSFLKKYPGDAAMPLASTCSAAISAACHPPEADKDTYLLPVQWGVVGKTEDGIERCSFTTSRDVVAPTPGSEYLGISPADLDRHKPWWPH